jgi:hypothetical protein
MTTEFIQNLPAGVKLPLDPVGDRILREYGAVFVTTATKPPAIIFRDQDDVAAFRAELDIVIEVVSGIKIELQAPAARAYLDAAEAAEAEGLTITPRGEDASGRSYSETVGLWRSRVDPGLVHWVREGRVDEADADRIRRLPPFEQVPAILELEASGLYFAKDLSKSIMYSVAPPGTSQHLSLLALDVAEHADNRVQELMADAGWFQTVASDLPHFTYLGHSSDRLRSLGLKRVEHAERGYWIPDL